MSDKYPRLPNQEINANNPNYEWLEKDYPGCLHLIFMQGLHAGVYEMHKRYPFGFRYGYSIQKDLRLDWFWDARELMRVRSVFLQKGKRNLKWFMQMYRQWERDHRANIALYDRAERVDFSALADSKLFDWYERLYHANVRQGATGYLADSFLSVGIKDWFSEFIKGRVGQQKDVHHVITILTAATIPTYTNEALTALQRLRLISNKKLLFKKLQDYAHKFYWIENNYFPKVLTAKDFFKQLVENMKNDTKENYANIFVMNRREKEALLRTLRDPYLAHVVRMAELMTHMQDYRKMALIRFTHFGHIIFREMAKRRGIKLVDLYNTVEPELEDIFLKHKVDHRKLKLRAKKNFIYGTPKGYLVYEGSNYKRYVNEFDFIQKVERMSEIQGVSASPGVVQGIVRIIKDAKRGELLKKGDILVTNNTTPEFVPLMKRAGAIVTEQGGITTHAAIVARELKKPCIIGTKIATKVFKDGDLVEVDAEHGIVRKI